MPAAVFCPSVMLNATVQFSMSSVWLVADIAQTIAPASTISPGDCEP